VICNEILDVMKIIEHLFV
jgi:hypothetical protein